MIWCSLKQTKETLEASTNLQVFILSIIHIKPAIYLKTSRSKLAFSYFSKPKQLFAIGNVVSDQNLAAKNVLNSLLSSVIMNKEYQSFIFNAAKFKFSFESARRR